MPVANHFITLQGYDPSFNTTSDQICNGRLLPIIQGAGSLPPSGTNLISDGTFSSHPEHLLIHLH